MNAKEYIETMEFINNVRYDILTKVDWKTIAKKYNFYVESQFNGDWRMMNKNEILEEIEILNKRIKQFL